MLNPAPAGAAHPDHPRRRGAQVRPFRRASGLACLVLDSRMKAPRSAPCFYIGPPGLPHRDGLVRRARAPAGPGPGRDQPWRAHQLPHLPRGVPTWNSRPSQRSCPPGVHRWSLANPCASGPSALHLRAGFHCCGLSFSRDNPPRDAAPQHRPSRQPCATAAPTLR